MHLENMEKDKLKKRQELTKTLKVIITLNILSLDKN